MIYEIAQIITMQCAGHCPYCMYGSKLNKQEECSLSDLLVFYDKIDGGLIIKITGGEPLQPNNLERTIAFVDHLYSTRNIVSCQINTNGYWGIPKELMHKGIHFQVSCDGPAEYQNACYGQEIFPRLQSTLKQLSIEPKQHHIMMVLTPETLQYVDYVQKLAAAHFMRCKMQWVAPVDGAADYAMDKRFEVIPRLQRIYGDTRQLTFMCGMGRLPANHVRFGIDAQGNIINCPIMSHRKSALTIYNCGPSEVERIKAAVNKAMNHCSCQFPNGFDRYVQQCSPQQLAKVSQYLKTNPEVQDDIHQYFGITL